MRSRYLIAIATVLALAVSGTVKAQELNADETQALLIQAPWKVEAYTPALTARGRHPRPPSAIGGQRANFLWNSDGTLCVKMFDPQAESCDDTGTWTRDGTEVCRKLEWWGKAYNLHEACFHVVKTESGGYETISANGLTELEFTMLDSN